MTQPSTPRVVNGVPPWVPIALGEIGVIEDTRAGKSTKRIEEYHACTRAGTASDDVPWCASFVSFCLEHSGFASTRSKTAASYERWGKTVAITRPFAVIGFGKADPDAGGTGHVAFSLGVSGGSIYVLGGNQQNRVSIATRRLADVKWARFPAGFLDG